MYCLSSVGKAPTSDLWQNTALGSHNPKKQLSYRNWPRPRKHMTCEAVMGTDEDKARITLSPADRRTEVGLYTSTMKRIKMPKADVDFTTSRRIVLDSNLCS